MNSRDNLSNGKADGINDNTMHEKGGNSSGTTPVRVSSSTDAAPQKTSDTSLFADAVSNNNSNPGNTDLPTKPAPHKAQIGVTPNQVVTSVDNHFKNGQDIGGGTVNNNPNIRHGHSPMQVVSDNRAVNSGSVVNGKPARPVQTGNTANTSHIANQNSAGIINGNSPVAPRAGSPRVMPQNRAASPAASNTVNPSNSGVGHPNSNRNPNNATRIMPRTPVGNINQANNNTTRIMPGVPMGRPVPAYGASDHIAKTANSGENPENTHSQPDNSGKTVVMNNVRISTPNSKTTLTPAVRHGAVNTKSAAQNNNVGMKKKVKKRGTPWIGVLKFVLYISFVVVISVLLAKYSISVGNDMFAFVKDSYNFTDTVYSVKGDAQNAFRITNTNLSGDKFEFTYAFKDPLSEAELDALDASCTLIKTTDNSIVHNFGKYTDDVIKNNPIVIDLSSSDMKGDVYLLRFTVNTGNNISYITEFTLSKKGVSLNIKQNASAKDVAKLLEENGLIEHPTIFKMYINLKSDDDEKMEFVSGDHTLYLGMDYDEILYAITPRKNVRSIVKLTFPEGSTVDEIIDILIKGGVKNSKQDYIDAINNYADFDYRFIDLLEQHGFSNDRVYALEGYLFPDTYEFYTDASPKAVLDKFLSNFDAKFDASFYDEAERLGLTVDELVTIASLVEAEAGNPEDKGNISSVFHNRLNNSGVYPYLESDATTNYASYDLRSVMKLTDYRCKKCGEKDVEDSSKCSNCGNNNSYEEHRCASFKIDLSEYALKDGVYYINFNVRTDITRSVALIDITKKTSGDKAVYSIGAKTASDSPINGDMKVSIEEASIDANGILTCEFGLSHSFTSEEFMKFPIKLNLFRKAYNTYLTPGLMPGAIANPGYESLISALYPNDTNYYFFVADNTGNSHFSTTNDEHNATIADLERNGKSVTAN